MERETNKDIKNFFEFIRGINSEYMAWMKFIDVIFIVITLVISIQYDGIVCILAMVYLSFMMMFFYMRQYLFTGTYEAGSVNADVQNIYSVIKYAPFDEKALRNEKIRILFSFLLKITAAGLVIQIIKYLTGPESYTVMDFLWTTSGLFIWPALSGIIYIIWNEKTAG